VFDDFKLFINLSVDSGKNSQWYAFGNYAKRRIDAGFSYRNPNTRSGVFASALNLTEAQPNANGNAIPFLVDENNISITRDLIVDNNGVIRSDLGEQPWRRCYDSLVADLTPDRLSGNYPQTQADSADTVR
jgi:iron complex outermembrane receptor protein